jgi:hypothetical protein
MIYLTNVRWLEGSAFGLGKSTHGAGFIILRLTLGDKIIGVTNVADVAAISSVQPRLCYESIPSC